MKYKDNWEETRRKFTGYWEHQNTGRPLMCVIARKPEIEALSERHPESVNDYSEVMCQGRYYNLPEELKWKDMEDKYQNAERMVARYRHFCENHLFLAESFPNLNVDFGPGSLAAYLGSDIGFRNDTVWFQSCIGDWEGVPEFRFNPENSWFQKHIRLVKRCRELAGDDFYVDMPDLMENVDVLASLRGAMNLLYDMAEEPELVKERVDQVTAVYYEYYNRFYELIQDGFGGNAYTVFQIWGPGKTVKLQCDLSAMMSPAGFRELVLESLKEQAGKADHVLYHLDGPDAVKHLDALLEVEGIDAVQWVSGDTGPDGTLEKWDEIYDKVIAAGKSLWIKVYSGELEDWIRNCERLVWKYGSDRLFFHFPEMSYEEAVRLTGYAEEHWSDIRGTFRSK